MTNKSKADEALAKYFTAQEQTDRSRVVKTLRNFQGSYEAAAKALTEVKEKRLYRPHLTIKEFCEKECGWSVSRIYQITKFLQLKSKLPPEVSTIVESEGVAREVAKLPEEDQERVLREAKATGKVTAKVIKELAEKTPKLEDTIIELDATGCKIPEKALIVWNRRHEAEGVLKALQTARDMMQELKAMQEGPNPDLMYCEVKCGILYARISSIVADFKRAVPYAVCTTCQGVVPETCVHCKGRGMISKFNYDHYVKPELKEIRKKAQQ
jgi:hypothetical protein